MNESKIGSDMYFSPDEPPKGGADSGQTSDDNHETIKYEDRQTREIFNYLEKWVHEYKDVYDPKNFEEVVDIISRFSAALADIKSLTNDRTGKEIKWVVPIEKDEKPTEDSEPELDTAQLEELGTQILSKMSVLREPIDAIAKDVVSWSKERKYNNEFFTSLVDRVRNDSTNAMIGNNEEISRISALNGLAEEKPEHMDFIVNLVSQLDNFSKYMARVLHEMESFYRNMESLVEHRSDLVQLDHINAAYGEKSYRKSAPTITKEEIRGGQRVKVNLVQLAPETKKPQDNEEDIDLNI